MLVLQVVYPIYDVELISCCFPKFLWGVEYPALAGWNIRRPDYLAPGDWIICPLDSNLHIVIL
jgi:hypothetical protein